MHQAVKERLCLEGERMEIFFCFPLFPTCSSMITVADSVFCPGPNPWALGNVLIYTAQGTLQMCLN